MMPTPAQGGLGQITQDRSRTDPKRGAHGRGTRCRRRRFRLDGPGAHPGVRPGPPPLSAPGAAPGAGDGRRGGAGAGRGGRRAVRVRLDDPGLARGGGGPAGARGEHHGPQLPAPRDRRRDGRGGQAHLGGEAGRPVVRRCAGGGGRRVRGRCAGRGRLQLPQRPGRGDRPPPDRGRGDRHRHPCPPPLLQRLRGASGGCADLALRAGARRQRGARRPGLARRDLARSCSATSPR